VDEDKKARAVLTAHEVNFVGADIQKMLRSKKVSATLLKDFPIFNR
jgi:hypothetical protein